MTTIVSRSSEIEYIGIDNAMAEMLSLESFAWASLSSIEGHHYLSWLY